jgi:hypothetical protein
MSVFSRCRRLITAPLFTWPVSAFVLFVAVQLLLRHVTVVQEVRATALPLAQEIPQLERRLRIITEQEELAQLQEALRIGSPEERVHVYALPEESDLDKTVTALDLLRDELSTQKLLTRMSDIRFGEVGVAEGGIRRQPVSLAFAAHQQGLAAFMLFVKLSGLLTVADALSADQRSTLLKHTELENPAGIVALERFLSTDLLEYLRDSRTYEEQLLKSFSTQAFEQVFRGVLRSSILPDAQRLLAGRLGQALQAGRLWPLQMLSPASISLESGSAPEWYRVEVVLSLYSGDLGKGRP